MLSKLREVINSIRESDPEDNSDNTNDTGNTADNIEQILTESLVMHNNDNANNGDVLIPTVCVACHREVSSADEDRKIIRSNSEKSFLSPEQLCIKCEIVKFPERFHGCAFCRKPLRCAFACCACRIGFAEWVKKVIPKENLMFCGVRKNAMKTVTFLLRDGSMINREFINSFNPDASDTDRLVGLVSCLEWKGFYAGITNIGADGNPTDSYLPTWIIPSKIQINPRSISLVKGLTDAAKLKLFENKLIQILEHNHIYLYKDVQIDLVNFDSSKIKSVTPYNSYRSL